MNGLKASLGGVVVAALMTTGCVTPQKRTAIGAGVGTAAGAAYGAAIGGWKGAAVGAAAGAAVGAGVGNALDRQAQELKKVADTQRTEQGVLVNLHNDVLFDPDSAILKDSAIGELSEVGDILAKYPADRIQIEGHTDSTGTQGYNEELSVRRAQAVREVLRSRGVKDDQMLVLGRGESEPIAANTSADGRAKNRRVELHIDMPNQDATRSEVPAGKTERTAMPAK